MMARDGQMTPGVSLAGAVDLESLKHKAEAQSSPRSGAGKSGGFVVDVDESGFEAMVQTSTTFPILLLFWMPDDERLVSMATALADAVNAHNGEIQLCRIDAAANPSIAQAFRLQGAPALFALIAGRPMPLLQGLPNDDEMDQIKNDVIPRVIEVAHQAGVSGTAPRQDAKDSAEEDGAPAESASDPDVPPEHAEAHRLALAGDYAGAAQAYREVLEANPTDALAARERAKALLLARSGSVDVRVVRDAAAAHPDDVDAQLAVADVDMIGGQISDAFDRLLDFLSSGHRQDIAAVRDRLVEYFLILDPADPRLGSARRRLATLMY